MDRIERIAVVVVTYNSAPLLPRLLASIDGAAAGLRYELVVVDNASSDDSIAVARGNAPDATIVDLGANRGYAAGFNAGCEAAAPFDAVLVANPDMWLLPGSITRLAAAVATGSTGIAVPRIEDEAGALVRSLRREPTVTRAVGEALLGGRVAGRFAPLGETVQDSRVYAHPTTADWASGAAMLITADCLRTVGRWDESFFLYSEETDFALRARDAGFELRYVPDATVCHLGGDVHTSPELWTTLTRNRVALYARRHGRMRTAMFRGAVTVNELLRAATGSETHRAALRALLSPGADQPAGLARTVAP
jgi:N-acetylglucosaminyl-diphospho-decaprenol L-rhamnosyltransferase